MSDYDAVVIGGGIVGSAVGYHLAREGADTLLVDRRDEGRATNAGAGIVSPATSSRTGSTTWFEFALAAADYYPDLATELSASGYDHGYSPTDLVTIAVDAADREELDAAAERAERRTAEYGRPEPGSVKSVGGEDLQALFPPVAEGCRGLHFENAARVDGRRFSTALREAGEDDGLTVRDGDVTEIEVSGGRVRGVEIDGQESVAAHDVVVAGGAWSPTFAADLDVEIPIEPHRGQIVHLDMGHLDAGHLGAGHLDLADLDSGAGRTADWPLVGGFRGHYMVPWPDGQIAVGATREEGSGFAPRPTLGGLAEVTREALRVAPGLAEARHVETRVGLRPVSRDRLPVLGPVPDIEGAHLATGHGATGLQLGPYSGKLVADAVVGDEPAAMESFGVDRF